MIKGLRLAMILAPVLACIFDPVWGQVTVPDSIPDEVSAVLHELEAAGLSPTAQEQAEWLQALRSANPSVENQLLRPFKGTARLRGNFQGLDLDRGDLRLDIALSPVRLRTRFRADPAGPSLWAGALELKLKSNRVVAGYLGLESGCGLLLARPGRGRSLAADSVFRRARSSLASWSTFPVAGTIQGLGFDLGLGPVTGQGLAGNIWLGPGHLQPVKALSLVIAVKTMLTGIAGLTAGSGNGFSCWGRKKAPDWEWWGEAALWQADPITLPAVSWQSVVSLKSSKIWGVQGGFAQASGAHRSPLGVRSEFLKGDLGRGWGLRIFWRPVARLYLALLGGESRCRTSLPRARKELKRSWDFILRRGFGNSLKMDLRLRSTSGNRWQWSERFPWQSALPTPLDSRIQGNLGLAWQENNTYLKVTGKLMQHTSMGINSHRAQFGLTGRWNGNGGWAVRAGYGASWGDPLDLVSAVSPLPGIVLPRHWGNWQSETYLGLGFQHRQLKVWSGVSLRRPVPGSGKEPSAQAWSEMGWSW